MSNLSPIIANIDGKAFDMTKPESFNEIAELDTQYIDFQRKIDRNNSDILSYDAKKASYTKLLKMVEGINASTINCKLTGQDNVDDCQSNEFIKVTPNKFFSPIQTRLSIDKIATTNVIWKSRGFDTIEASAIQEKSTPNSFQAGSFWILKENGIGYIEVVLKVGDNLRDIAEKINNHTHQTGINAIVFKASGQYKLMIDSKKRDHSEDNSQNNCPRCPLMSDTAWDNSTKVDLGMGKVFQGNLSMHVDREDAEINLEFVGRISHHSNYIEDLIQGVTIELLKPTPLNQAIEIISGLSYNRFISSYNEIMRFITEQLATDRFGKPRAGSHFIGEMSVMSIQNMMVKYANKIMEIDPNLRFARPSSEMVKTNNGEEDYQITYFQLLETKTSSSASSTMNQKELIEELKKLITQVKNIIDTKIRLNDNKNHDLSYGLAYLVEQRDLAKQNALSKLTVSYNKYNVQQMIHEQMMETMRDL